MQKLVLLFLFALFSSSCQSGEKGCKTLDKKNCSVLKNFTVFDQNHRVHFNHMCSALDNKEYYRSSYAFFEPVNKRAGYKILALAEVHVGWYGMSGIKGINLAFPKFKVENFKDWAGDSFSLALKTVNLRSGHEVVGAFSESSFHGGPTEVRNQLSSKGDIDVEALIESEDKAKNKAVERMIKETRVDVRQIDSSTDDQQLYLIVKNDNKNSFIELKGPVVHNLKDLLKIEKPEMKVVGPLDFLNPFNEGGYWSFLRHGFRFQECVYLRKQAKKEFKERFSAL